MKGPRLAGQVVLVAGADGRSIRSARAALGGATFGWAYLAADPRGSEELPRALGPQGTRLDLPGALKRMAGALRHEYIEYVGALGQQNASDGWWRSCVSEKNPYISQTFLYACTVRACVELLGSNAADTPTLFIVQNRYLQRTLVRHLRGLGAEVRISESARSSPLALLRELLVLLARQAYWLATNLGRIALARYRWRLHRTQPVVDAIRAGTPVSIVHTWVDERAYDRATGEFHDLDFHDVAGYLEAKGKTVFTVPDVLSAASYRRVAGFIARSSGRYLLPHAFLRPSDLLRVLLTTLRTIPRRRGYPPFAGIDVSDLVYQDLRNEWLNHRLATVLLVESWVRRWKHAGIRIERFIYTFENHTWERTACQAFRRFYPGARLIGHQPNGLPLFLMNYFISTTEDRLAPLPDRIVTNGEFAAKILRASGYGAARLECGGGLRQKYLLGRNGNGTHPRSCTGKARILVTPSIGKNETVELLRKVIHAFETSPDVAVTLKCHPSMPFERVVGALGIERLPAHMTTTKQPVKTLIWDADLVIYNGCAFPSAEALMAGVPALFVEPDFALQLDPLGAAPELRESARAVEDVASCARRLLCERRLGQPDGASDRRRMANEIIGAVGETTYALFL